MKPLTLILVILSVFLGVSARGEFKVFHAKIHTDPAGHPVPPATLPAGVEPAYWTGADNAWWNPPTTQQVQAVARVARYGGMGWWRDESYPAGCFVILDGERRDDDSIEGFVNRFRSPNYAPGATFAVYALSLYTPVNGKSGNIDEAAAWDVDVVRGMERRAADAAGLIRKVPVLILEIYPQAPGDDERWYRGWDFQVACVRRTYPGKSLYAITRGDRGSAGSSVPLTDAETDRLARFLRSRFDAACAWGPEVANDRLLRALVAAR